MVQKDKEFKKRLLETFKIEASEHIKNISSGLIDLEKTTDAEKRTAIIESIFRESHSLKGSARVVSMSEIESVCQSLESVISALKSNELIVSPEIFDSLQTVVDNLSKLLAADFPESPSKQALANNTVQLLESILKGSPVVPSMPALEEMKKTEMVALKKPIPETAPVTQETVRIMVSKLESLLLQAEELLTSKQAANQLSRDLEEVNSNLAGWEREWQKISARVSQLRSRTETDDALKAEKIDPQIGRLIEFLYWNHNYFKSLERKVEMLSSVSRREGNSLSNRVDSLTQDMKKVLMSPFSSVTETFPKFVRDLSREQGKEIEFLIHGDEIEIDRRILEEIKDPFDHLVRNCIDHGIERPEVREQRGKSPRGTITVAISQRGSSNIEIMVADDGQGIEIQGVREAAIKQGIISQEEADKLREDEVLSLIYRSGVSTSSTVTDISGRGLGLAIAREKVEKLRGTISVESQPGQGTTFRIVVPLTLSEFRGLVVRAGGQMLIIPTVNVERAIRIKKETIQTIEGGETIQFAGQVISLVRLADVLELTPEERPGDFTEYFPVLLLAWGGMRLAFWVDEIVDEQEVLVKSLGKQLSRVRNIAGASMLSNGKVVPVLNIGDLMKSAIKARVVPTKSTTSEETTKQPAILVVEDSITARTLLKNILETVGYRVRTAVDGLDAFAQLKAEKFDLVVSDVDMPRMNGFDLTTKIRGDRTLSAIPVVLVTALESREHRERGIDVGANAYIVKSSFDQGNLLEAIRRLI